MHEPWFHFGLATLSKYIDCGNGNHNSKIANHFLKMSPQIWTPMSKTATHQKKRYFEPCTVLHMSNYQPQKIWVLLYLLGRLPRSSVRVNVNSLSVYVIYAGVAIVGVQSPISKPSMQEGRGTACFFITFYYQSLEYFLRCDFRHSQRTSCHKIEAQSPRQE